MANFALDRFSWHFDRGGDEQHWFFSLPEEYRTDVGWVLANVPDKYMLTSAALGCELTPLECLFIARHFVRNMPAGNGYVFDLLPDSRLKNMVVVGELLTVGRATMQQLNVARQEAIQACLEIPRPEQNDPDLWHTYVAQLDAAISTCAPNADPSNLDLGKTHWLIHAMASASIHASAELAWRDATEDKGLAFCAARDLATSVVAAKTRAILLARGI